jgi:hypothetical protein
MFNKYIFLIVIFYVTTGNIMGKAQNEGRSISGNSDLLLKTSELKKLSLKAMQGDGNAALNVAHHYTFGMQDEVTGNYWLVIGAENGDARSQWNISLMLNYPPLSDGITTRGVFWVQKAAKNGIQYAIDELVRLGISFYGSSPDDDLNSMDFSNVFTENELEQCKEFALQGSQAASLILTEHYKSINRPECVEYWLRVGVQNGSAECQYVYGQILSGKEEILDQERGKFWINSATQNGYSPSS